MPEQHVSTLLCAPNQGTTPDFVPQDSMAQTGFVATCHLGFHGIVAGTFDFLGFEDMPIRFSSVGVCVVVLGLEPVS